MMISALIRNMAAAGAGPEAIAIAVESIEAARTLADDAMAAIEARKNEARDRKRRERARKSEISKDVTDSHATCHTMSRNVTDETLPLPSSPQTPQLPTPTRGINTRARKGPIEKAFDDWNLLAEKLSLPIAKTLTPERRKHISARLGEAGPQGWNEALAGVEASKYCRGQNGRSWKADLDFVCQLKSFNRLREFSYGNDANLVEVSTTDPSKWSVERWTVVMNRYRSTGTWPQNAGAPPENNETLVPETLRPAKDRAA